MDKGLHQKLDLMPDNLKSEVEHFVDFLLTEKKKKQAQSKNNSKKPKFGSGKGMFKMIPGFDEPLEDFKDYMY